MRRFLTQAEQFTWRVAAANDFSEPISDLTGRLHQEFTDWATPLVDKTEWPHGGKWAPKPEELVGEWPYVERFLKEKYPAAHQGFDMGREEARPGVNKRKDNPYPSGPEAVAQYGYDPREVAAGMLMLHIPEGTRHVNVPKNVLNNIFKQRMEMQRNYEQRQANSRLAAVNQEMVDGLNDQFHDWWGQQNNSGGSADDMAQMDFMDEDRGPIGHWPNIENFLKDEYPAAHRGLATGMEAEWSLDGHAKPYLTGPAAIKEHGYDPSEIAAGVLLLHNQSDPFRGDMAQQDQDRLNDIAQKRFKMQRNYDNRQSQPAAKELVTAAHHLAEFNQELIDNLRDQYHNWYDEHGNERLNWAGRGPLGNWSQIENFLKMQYPAAHKGLATGKEETGKLLDTGYVGEGADYCPSCHGSGHHLLRTNDACASCSGSGVPSKPLAYETGPEAVNQHGYDPKEVAAGMLLLHNKTHPDRGDILDADIDRLSDIAQKRSEMQRNYDNRQSQPAAKDLVTAQWRKTAADLVKEYTDGLSDEFHDWAREQEYVPVGFSKNDPAVMNPDYTKPMGGPLNYWDNIEGFFKDRYPAVHRGYRYGEENAADALDGHSLRMPARYSPWPNRSVHPGYETGPEAVEKYGYDPRQVAAGFMYLHSTAHNTARPNDRANRIPRDIDRLADIFQKRQQMQNNYEQKQQVPQPITAALELLRITATALGGNNDY
jgi:hypothetical protein